MRMLVVALAFGLAACGVVVSGPSEGPGEQASADTDGYTLEIRATATEQTYLILTPDGRTVGARAAEGASALMESGRAQALAATPPPEGEEAPEVMSLRIPGFQMSVAGVDENAEGEQGQVRMTFGSEGQNIVVNADEGGPGDADDRAYVRISGADEQAVRDFINEAEELSPDVKTQVLAELGLR